jgi:hypothetical protein
MWFLQKLTKNKCSQGCNKQLKDLLNSVVMIFQVICYTQDDRFNLSFLQ